MPYDGNLQARMTTREKIEKEIAEGKLGVARDRLHGLVTSYPHDLELRSRLGDVYHKLGYPREAGRYWFLDPDPDDEKLTAISLFIAECNGDPSRILHRLKLRIHPDELKNSRIRQKVDALVAECRKSGSPVPDWSGSSSVAKSGVRLWGYSCLAVIVLCALVFGLGVVKLIEIIANH